MLDLTSLAEAVSALERTLRFIAERKPASPFALASRVLLTALEARND